MNEDFIKFATIIGVLMILSLFFSNSGISITNKKSIYSKNKTETKQYYQVNDYYRGVPVEVK